MNWLSEQTYTPCLRARSLKTTGGEEADLWRLVHLHVETESGSFVSLAFVPFIQRV